MPCSGRLWRVVAALAPLAPAPSETAAETAAERRLFEPAPFQLGDSTRPKGQRGALFPDPRPAARKSCGAVERRRRQRAFAFGLPFAFGLCSLFALFKHPVNAPFLPGAVHVQRRGPCGLQVYGPLTDGESLARGMHCADSNSCRVAGVSLSMQGRPLETGELREARRAVPSTVEAPTRRADCARRRL
ncbi:hypothetical protein M885DRAFT_1815 [Pelagophyceae sp. CCMP2097]|nr:hypothetical protein M885DRAFT_1815 [Pelagophyceae sp. CCMP2097]